MQHVVLRATWYEGTPQLLSLTELKSHLFELYITGRTIKPMKDDSWTKIPKRFFFFFFFLTNVRDAAPFSQAVVIVVEIVHIE